MPPTSVRQNQRRRRHAGLISPDEFCRAVRESVFVRETGALPDSGNVFGELATEA